MGTLYHDHRVGTRARIHGDGLDIEIFYLYVTGTRAVRNAVLRIRMNGEEPRDENLGSRRFGFQLCEGVKIRKGFDIPPSNKRISIGYEVDRKYQIDFDDSVRTDYSPPP